LSLLSEHAWPEPPPITPTPPKKRKRRDEHGRRKVPSHLPKRRAERKVEGDARKCPTCGKPMTTIGTATANRLEWVPGHFVNLEVACEKCACADHPGAGVVTAEPPAFAIDKGLCGNGLLAKVIVDKYADHIPLNRQSKRFARLSVDIPVSTMCGWLRKGAEPAGVLVRAMLGELIAGSWLQSDATGVPVLDGTKGQPGKGHFYTWSNGEQVVYTFAPDGTGKHPAEILARFEGTLVADGGSAYHPATNTDRIERAGCWAHARRKFFQARDDDPVTAQIALAAIREIFLVERAVQHDSPEDRARLRRELAGPVLEQFHDWCRQQSLATPPKSPTGQALGYVLRQWDTLQVFLDNGDIPAHNNLSELMLRQPVVGRKNWLFAGNTGGARTAATWFTLIGSCMLQAIDPQTYLADVLPRLPSYSAKRVLELSPAAWRVERLGLDA
jgi:transposase